MDQMLIAAQALATGLVAAWLTLGFATISCTHR